MGPFTFQDFCHDYVYENFENSFLPQCWSEANQGTPANFPVNFGNSNWEQANYANGSSNLSAKINIHGTAVQDWLITPLIETDYPIKEEILYITLEFTIALTQHNSTDAAMLGSDDQVQLVFSNDYGLSWVVLHTWDATSIFPNINEYVLINETTSSNSSFHILAFWASSGNINDTENVNFFIDNVSIQFSGSW